MTKRFWLKGAIIVAAAAGCFFACSAAASAKVVDTAFQPTTAGIAKLGLDASKPNSDPLAVMQPTAQAPQIKKADPPPPTPAPEPVVPSVQARTPSFSATAQSESPLSRAVAPVQRGVKWFGSYLGRVVSSCPVGPVSSTGGPVIALAVLSVGLALNRRRVLAALPATDECVPEFLFAWELTPPG